MEKDITYTGENGAQIRACISTPGKATGKLPSIILIHEIYGLDAHTRDVAKRLTNEGYLVIAPHLFHGELDKITSVETLSRLLPLLRTIPRESFGNPEKIKEVSAQLTEQDRPVFKSLMEVLAGKHDQQFVNNLKHAYQYIVEHENADSKKTASLGFCFGGGMAGLLAVNEPRMAAHIIFYGKRPPADKIKNITAPILGIYGSLDAGISPGIPTLAEEMKAAGKNYQYIMYEGASHAFFNNNRKDVYHPQAAAKAWEEVKTFLKKNL